MQMSKRSFSGSSTSAGTNYFALGMGAAALTGLTYVNYKAAMTNKYVGVDKQMSRFDPIVKQRLSNTMGYFTYACSATGAMMFLMRNNMQLAMMNPWGLFAASIALMIGTMYTDY